MLARSVTPLCTSGGSAPSSSSLRSVQVTYASGGSVKLPAAALSHQGAPTLNGNKSVSSLVSGVSASMSAGMSGAASSRSGGTGFTPRSSVGEPKNSLLTPASLRTLPSLMEEVIEVERLSKASGGAYVGKDDCIKRLETEAHAANERMVRMKEEFAEKEAQEAVQQLQLRTVIHEEASESQAMRVYTQHLQGHAAGAPQAVQQQAWARERGRFFEEIQELKTELATKDKESSKHTRILETELKREKEATRAVTEDAARARLEAGEASKQSEGLRVELQKQLATRATSTEATKGTIMQLEMELRLEVQAAKAATAKELELHQEVRATNAASAKATEAICEAAEHIRVLERDKALSLEAAEDARSEASEVATCLRAVLKNPSWCHPDGEDRSGTGGNVDDGHGPKETKRVSRLERECAELRQELREAMNASTGAASIMVRAETAEAAVRQLQGQVAGLDMEARSQVKLARLEAAKNAAVASSETARAEGLAHERQMLEDQLRGIQFQSKDLCDELGALKTAAAAVRSAATSKDDIIDELKAERAALARQLREQIVQNGDLDETVKTHRQPPRFGKQAVPRGSADPGDAQEPRPSYMSVVNLLERVESFMTSRNSAAPSHQSTAAPTSPSSATGYVQRTKLSRSASSEPYEHLSESPRSKDGSNPAQQGHPIVRPALVAGRHLVGQGHTSMPPEIQPCSRVAAAVADALTQAPTRVESAGSAGLRRVAPGGIIPPEIERGSPERTTPKDVPTVSRRSGAGVDADVPSGVLGHFREELSSLWRLYTQKGAEVGDSAASEVKRAEVRQGVPSDQTIRRLDGKEDVTSPKTTTLQEDNKHNVVTGQAPIHSRAPSPLAAPAAAPAAAPRLSQAEAPAPPNQHQSPWACLPSSTSGTRVPHTARSGVSVETIRKQDSRDAAGPDGRWTPANGANKTGPPPVCHSRNSAQPSLHASPVGSVERHMTTPPAGQTSSSQAPQSSLRSHASSQNPAVRYRTTSPHQLGMQTAQAQQPSLNSSTSMPKPAGLQPPHHASSPLQMAPPSAMRQGYTTYQPGRSPGAAVYRPL